MNAYALVLLRTIIAFITLFLISKVLGNKLISQMTYFDYIAGISLGTLAGTTAMDYTANFGPYFLSLVLWGLFSFAFGFLSLKYRNVRKFVQGEPTLVIQNGQILEENMKCVQYNLDDLLINLRHKNIFNVSDVEFALLEPDGHLSVLPKSQKRPVNPQDLKISTSYEGMPTEIIMDGKIVYANLRQHGLDEAWLKAQLEARSVNSIQDVVLAQLLSTGDLYIDLKSETFPVYQDPTDKA